MVDNLAPDVQQETNTTFLEQRAIMQETTFPSSVMSMPRKIELEMAESHWTARQQLSKPMQLSQVSWTTTQAPGTTIVDFTFPEVLSTMDSVISRTLRMYAFYKLSPIFRFQLNSTQFHQGQLIISFDPFRQSRNTIVNTPNDVTPLFNRYYATGLPSIKIMASESDPVELRIPYIHPRQFLTSNSSSSDVYNLMGEIRVTVLNQLRVAEGTSPQLTLTTWVYAADASVHVPISDHNITVEPTSLVSSLFSNGSNLIGNLVTGNIGKGLRNGQGLIDDLGKLFGFDYPVVPLAPPNTIKPVETLANARGATRSERLALDPVSGHQVDTEETMIGRDEMDVLAIARMPMLLSQFAFSGTDPPQSRLLSIPVTPNIYAPLGSGDVPSVQPSFLSYVSNFFCFWSGSIQYEFEFVATRFHSGKLLIGFVPNYVNINTLTYQQFANSHPTAILDIQQTSKISFTVPFQSATPLKVISNSLNDESVLGTVVVFVQNQLTYASNVSPQIDVNVYIRAGDDFSLSVPRFPQDIDYERPAPPTISDPLQSFFSKFNKVEATSDITFQTSRTGQEDNSSTAVLSHGQSYSTPKPRFGETYSLIDCLRRFTSFVDQFSSLNETNLLVHPVYTGSFTNDITDPNDVYIRNIYQPHSSYLSYFGKIFSCWSGSLRYKIMTTSPRSSTSKMSVYHIPDYSYSYSKLDTSSESTLSGYAATSTDLAQNNALEFEVPFYSPYNFLLTSPSSTPADFVPTTRDNPDYYNYASFPVVDGVLSTFSVPANSRIYIAAGEDFRYFYLRSPPPLYGFQYNTPT